MKRAATILALSATTLLSGCTGCMMGLCTSDTFAKYPGERFVASGLGTQGSGQMNATQQRLMAMRAARVDAYRNLSEQLYGVRVSGHSTVNSFATQNDQVRTYVDHYLRGARLINMAQLADGSFEATLEVEVPGNFRTCISQPTTPGCALPATPARPAQPAPTTRATPTQCGDLAGCTLTTPHYVSAN